MIHSDLWFGFENGKNMKIDELACILRGCYRVLIDGSIGKINKIMLDLFADPSKNVKSDPSEDDKPAEDNMFIDLIGVADRLSQNYLEISINQDVDHEWLIAKLKQVDIKKAPRVFNLCFYPEKGSDFEFKPDNYDKKKTVT